MLIGLHERGEKVDLILFADTGGEKPHTYAHVLEMSEWLVAHGMPQITTVRVKSTTLEGDCLKRNALPSVAYGFKTCSQRFKAEPQEKLLRQNGIKEFTKLIGFDADEPQRAKPYPGNRYPLIEWGWGRDECIEAIDRAGITQPGKSACFFCPSSKKKEILELRRVYPDLAARAVAMERNALGPKCDVCGGRGFSSTASEALLWASGGDGNCPKCKGTGHEAQSIKGLGRNFAWADLYDADDRQVDMFGHSGIEIDCGCYDG